MNSKLILLSLASIFFIFSCNLLNIFNKDVTKVSITIPVSRSLSDYVKSYKLTVSGNGFEDIVLEPNEESDLSLEVPSGSNRTFTLELYNSDKSLTLYKGSKTINLEPGETTLSIDVFRNSFQLEYSLNNAEQGEVPASAYYNSGSEVTVVNYLTLPVLDEYSTFNGWNSAADGSGTSYAIGSKIKITEDTTLFANFTDKQTYSITYDLNGGIGSISNSSPVIEGENVTLSDGIGLTNSGHIITGWIDNSSELTYDLGQTIPMPSGGLNLSAIWEVSYTVSYDSNGGTGSISNSIPVIEGEYVTLSTDIGETNPGYYIKSWNTSFNGDGVSYNLGQVINMPSNDLTLYAIWEAIPIEIYVSTTGNDQSGDGTSQSPFNSIEYAVKIAEAGSTTDIFVAEGAYTIDSTINLKAGISVQGGYDSSTWDLDPANNLTELNANEISSLIKIDSITTALFSGFTINYSIASTGSGKVFHSIDSNDIIISNNIVYLNSHSYKTFFIYSDNSDLEISNNKLLTESMSSYSGAIYFTSSTDSIIVNNIIDNHNTYYEGGSITTNRSGTYNLIIRNNIINSGYIGGYNGGAIGTRSEANFSYGSANLTLSIDNNVFSTNNSPGGTKKYNLMYFTVPSVNITIPSFKNNVIYNNISTFDNVMFFEGPTNGDGDETIYSDIASFETQYSDVASGNFTFTTLNLFNDIANNDFTFGNGVDTSVTAGGIDGSSNGWSFDYDINGASRTAPWSIGPYEID